VRNKLALVVAIVLGLVAVWGVYKLIQQKEAKHEKEYEPVAVATAGQRIKAGTRIEMKMLEERGRVVSADSLTADHILDREKFILLGQTINRDVERGEPLLRSYFQKPVERLQDRLSHGERAVTISVDAITGVAGHLVPGSHVDIVGTFPIAKGDTTLGPAQAGGQAIRTRLLLTNVTVLAVGEQTREAVAPAFGRSVPRARYNNVTLAVTPEEADMLIFAQAFGTLTLVLRAPADSHMVEGLPEVHAGNFFDLAAQSQRARVQRLRKQVPIQVMPRTGGASE